MSIKKQIILVGDRVLVRPETERERTNSGLYLPLGLETREKVQTGYVIKVGPGYPVGDPASDEIWSETRAATRYIPLQAEEGDYVVFLRKSAIEIEFENEHFLVVPHPAILLLVRDDLFSQMKADDPEGI